MLWMKALSKGDCKGCRKREACGKAALVPLIHLPVEDCPYPQPKGSPTQLRGFGLKPHARWRKTTVLRTWGCERRTQERAGVAHLCPHVFCCTFAPSLPRCPGPVPLPWGFAGRDSTRASSVCAGACPRICSGTWDSPGGRPATPLLPQLEKPNLASACGLGAWPFSLQRQSWRCCPPPSPPVRTRAELCHGSHPAPSAAHSAEICLFLSRWAVALM